MPAILDFLYREYCRARLVEMRGQLFLIQANSPENTQADGNIRSGAANASGSGVAQREDGQPRPT